MSGACFSIVAQVENIFTKRLREMLFSASVSLDVYSIVGGFYQEFVGGSSSTCCVVYL